MQRRSKVGDTLAGVGRWVPFASRTAAYGLASCVAGPLTGGRASLACMRAWCVSSVRGLGIRVAAHDVERVRDAGPAILVSNHESVLDILVLGSALDVDYKWVAKRALFKVPFLGWHLALAGHIPVDRARQDNFEQIDRGVARALASGASVLFFPEGTRSTTGELRAFRTGAFLAAVRHGVPVVPVVLDGTGELMKKGEWDIDADAARYVSVRVLPAIAAPRDGDEMTRATVLRDRARAAMKVALEGAQRHRARARAADAAA